MQSLTKRRLTGEQIEELVRHGLGPQTELQSYEEIEDGAFSAVFGLRLGDGRELVLKVAPDPGVTLMRHEADLTHAEAEFYRRAGAAGVRLPTLYAADPDRGYLLMERLRGEPLRAAKQHMTAAQEEQIRREAGGIGARLGTATAPRFGYPRRDGHTRSTSWRATFLTFLEDVLADADDHRSELPVPVGTIRGLVERHADLLEEVTVPVLVHFDLWDGNVFVTGDGDGYRIEGVIDGERSFFGDPIAELVSLALFRDPAEVPGLLPGFLGRPLTGHERVRLRLYSIYLYLIMVTEGVPRGFDHALHEPVRRHCMGLLDAELSRL